jgi:hypothetical protein
MVLYIKRRINLGIVIAGTIIYLEERKLDKPLFHKLSILTPPIQPKIILVEIIFILF